MANWVAGLGKVWVAGLGGWCAWLVRVAGVGGWC